jgi:hypothetical protein
MVVPTTAGGTGEDRVAETSVQSREPINSKIGVLNKAGSSGSSIADIKIRRRLLDINL